MSFVGILMFVCWDGRRLRWWISCDTFAENSMHIGSHTKHNPIFCHLIAFEGSTLVLQFAITISVMHTFAILTNYDVKIHVNRDVENVGWPQSFMPSSATKYTG